MTSTRTPRRYKLTPAGRLRLVRRVGPILTAAVDDAVGRHEPTEPILEAFAYRLAEHGIAATATLLEDLIDDVRDLYAFEYGAAPIGRWLDLDRWFGTHDEASAWVGDRLTRAVRSSERRLAGA